MSPDEQRIVELMHQLNLLRGEQLAADRTMADDDDEWVEWVNKRVERLIKELKTK